MSVVHIPGGPRSQSRHFEVLYYAGVVNACIRHRDFVDLITRTAIVNHGGGLAKINQVTFPEPIYHLCKIYGTVSGRWPVACTVECPQYDSVLSDLDLPAIVDVPALECLALLNDAGDRLTLLVTNRGARQEVSARITVAGFAPAPRATTRTIAGRPEEINLWNAPPSIAIVGGNADAAQEFSYAFPACSVTELVLSRAS